MRRVILSLKCVVSQQLVDQINVSQYHAPTAIPFEAQLIQCVSEN
jgi:hypothetical protein